MINDNFALRRVSVVDDVKGIIRGYIAIWGIPMKGEIHRDSYGTYFDKERPPEMGLDFLPIPLIYEHGFDGGIKKEVIGRVIRAWFDDIGIAFEAVLDRTAAAFTRFIAEIRSGKLATSSATSEHLAEFDDNGRFVNWPLSELSLTANPAEELMPAVQLMRSKLLHDATDKSQGEIAVNERKQSRQGNNQMLEAIIAALNSLGPDATTEQIIQVLTDAGLSAEDFAGIEAQLALPQEGRQEDGEDMPAGGGEGDTPATEEVVTAVDQMIAAVGVVLEEKGATEAAAELEAERSRRSNELERENSRLNLSIAMRNKREQEMPNERHQPRHGNGGGVTVGDDMESWKYAHLTSSQMLYGHMLLNESNRPESTISDGYIRHMAAKTLDRVDAGPSAFRSVEAYQALRSSLRGATRADELIYTTNTGFGAEWIPAAWQDQLWETIFQTEIMTALQRDMLIVEASGQPGSTVSIALESSDPTWFSAAENQSVGADLNAGNLVDPSQIGTAKVEVTPGKAMMVVIVSTEMIEDSIINLLPQLDKQVKRSAERTLENMMLNGDTETAASTNINLIDGTPAGGTSAPFYLVTNGMLKYALVTGTSTSVDGGAFTTQDFLNARGLLPNELQPDPSRMIFVSDNSTQLKALALTDWKDISVSRAPTQESGIITTAWGSQYIASAQMAKANSAGKISATPGNNTLGRLLLVVPEYWAMVWKRKVKFTTTEMPKQDVTEVVASLRVAFQARSAGASTCVYNLTV